MFYRIFPIKVYLHTLQLEGYRIIPLLRWWTHHPFTQETGDKKPFVWTMKAKILCGFSIFWVIFFLFVFWPLSVLFFIFPVFPLVLSTILFIPLELAEKEQIKKRTSEKIDSLKNLKMIGIAGSFGKTTVKEFLYQILSKKYRCLRTPESYNTLFGVAKVVDLELDNTYDFFICEMGAYKTGEIAELCQMVKPKFGILTGINEQHLERFGSIENIIKAKFELPDFVLNNNGKMVINLRSGLVKGGIEKYKSHKENIIEYGKNIQTPLEQNLKAAKKMAEVLGMTKMEIENAAKDVQTPKHRLNVIKRDDLSIIDDAYSSNPDGFRAAIGFLKEFKGWKVVVTPGIVELGRATEEIHKELGGLMSDMVDQLILVGKNERTENLEKGYGKQVEYIEDVKDAMGKVKEKKATVLFENDLPDNY